MTNSLHLPLHIFIDLNLFSLTYSMVLCFSSVLWQMLAQHLQRVVYNWMTSCMPVISCLLVKQRLGLEKMFYMVIAVKA